MSVLLPRKSPRRTALRGLLGGAAVTVGLPFLDCFLDGSGKAIAATGARLPVRFGTWYWGLGLTPNYSIKTKVETSQGIAFLEECKALRPYEKHINYFEGFNTPLDGKGNYTHYSGYCAARTGTAASFSGDIPVPTLDILVADTIGAATRFPTIDVTSVGIPSQNYSARSTNSRAAAEASPAQLYARLFGPEFVDPNKGEFKPDPQVLARHSALSAVLEQSKKLQAAAGASDKARLDEYFTSIRQLENRLALQLEKPPPNQACMIPKAPKSAEEEAERHAGALEVETVHENHRLMSDMLAMAVACNQTNVFNMVYSDNLSHVRQAGSSTHHHQLTHEETVDQVLGYQPGSFFFGVKSMDAMAVFIEAFLKVREGDGTLLDNVLIYSGTETNYARVHSIDGQPMFLIGGAGGRVKTGYHVVGGGDPVTRVGFTAMQAMGVPIDNWGTKSLQTSKAISEILT